jgi:lipoate-protein ligase A
VNRESWRLLDTGLASAARNVALTRVLLEARHANESPSTLRFLRFAPSALLACNQSSGHELDLAYCAAQRIAAQRRIATGATWLADERQLGWELYLHRTEIGSVPMTSLAKRIGHAAATALSALGIDARYRAPEDIEVDGRVICTTGMVAEGGGVVFQGLLMLDPDFERYVRALRLAVPFDLAGAPPGSEPLVAAQTAARERIAGLTELLGRPPDLALVRRNLAEAFESEFDIQFREGELSLTEHARYQRALVEIDTPGWIDLASRPSSDMPLLRATHRVPGGIVRVTVKYDMPSHTVRQVWFFGDLHLNPRRTLCDLEAVLRDLPMSRVAARVEWFFRSRPVESGALSPGDFTAAVRLALGQRLVA